MCTVSVHELCVVLYAAAGGCVSEVGSVVCSGDHGNDDNEEVGGSDLVHEFQTLSVQSRGWCQPEKPTKVHTLTPLVHPLHSLTDTIHTHPNPPSPLLHGHNTHPNPPTSLPH